MTHKTEAPTKGFEMNEMDHAAVKRIVNGLLDSRMIIDERKMIGAIEKTVAETLKQLGINVADPFETQRDMAAIRTLRRAIYWLAATMAAGGVSVAVGLIIATNR